MTIKIAIFEYNYARLNYVFDFCLIFQGHAYAKDLQIRLKRDMFPDDVPFGDFQINVIVFMRKKNGDEPIFELKVLFGIEKD